MAVDAVQPDCRFRNRRPYCAHALVDLTSGIRARVIEAVKEQQKEIQDLKTQLEEVKAHACSWATPATKATTAAHGN